MEVITTIQYFINVNTLEELRKQYKNLLKQYHPDNLNGSTEVTQEINTEYDKLFKILKDKHNNKAADTNKTTFNHMEFDFTEDEKLREILQKIINFDGIIIDLVGT